MLHTQTNCAIAPQISRIDDGALLLEFEGASAWQRDERIEFETRLTNTGRQLQCGRDAAGAGALEAV